MKEFMDIYSKYNVDVNRLTRDYLKFPLQKITKQRYEKIPKEDFEYLYIECNLPNKVLQQYFNVSYKHINNLRKLYNLKKSKEQIVENYKKTCIENYGVENYFQSEECKEKVKQTNLERYGVEYSIVSPAVQEKIKKTNLQNFGVEYPYQSPVIREKVKQANLENFGVEYYSQSDEFRELFNDEEFVKRSKQKEYETKKKNGSLGKSEEEEKIYNLLTQKYSIVERQYKSELYPFRCDFYIPEIDLYIEYQGYFQHGSEPYIGTNEQNDLVNFWKGKGTEQYLNAVKTWTQKDVIKRNTAKQNNLNWIEFFNMKEFIKWFESI